MQKYAKHISWRILYLPDETSVYILKPCREIGQSFEESLKGVSMLSLET